MAQLSIPTDTKTLVAGVGAVAGAYLAYAWAGGEPLPVLKTFVPWIAGAVVFVALWKHLKK